MKEVVLALVPPVARGLQLVLLVRTVVPRHVHQIVTVVVPAVVVVAVQILVVADVQAVVAVAVPVLVVEDVREDVAVAAPVRVVVDVHLHVQVDVIIQQQDHVLLALRHVCRLVDTDAKTLVLEVVTPLVTTLVGHGVMQHVQQLRKDQTLVLLVMELVVELVEHLVLSIVPEIVITLAEERQVSLT